MSGGTTVATEESFTVRNPVLTGTYNSTVYYQPAEVCAPAMYGSGEPVRVCFTKREKKLIQELYIVHRDILNKKNKDSATNINKAQAWEAIAEKFNASPLVTNRRDVKSLKKCWENQLLAFKKAKRAKNGLRFNIGGGPALMAKAVVGRVADFPDHLIEQPKNWNKNDESVSTIQLKQEVLVEPVANMAAPTTGLPPPQKRSLFMRRKRYFPPRYNNSDYEVLEMRRREHEMKEEEHAIKMENLILKREVLKRKLSYYSGGLMEQQNGRCDEMPPSEYVLS